ncbi:unnamed protein product [Phaedon cochleariae]|uniref:Mitochondrial glutamate carrier 2 n=1 Tax=Phaedon cochleariae TaxID=80249 RepID=A0A9P0GVR4_PHACE|nr:unnamed protein product [Phaedon cochleariae]
MAEKQSSFSLLPKIINGGIAGIVGVTCVFPLDLVKTRLQNQKIGPKGEKMYNNMIDAFRKTYKSEGFFGMYRGSSINILLITPEKAIKLAANDFFRFHLQTKDKRLPIYRQMIAGGLAGLCQIIITTPMELLKIQMQDAGRIAAQTGDKSLAKMSATQVTMNLLKKHGILGLFKGTAATMLRDVSFSVIYFPVFANLNAMGPRRTDGSGEAVFWCSFLSGLVGGSIASCLVTPMDVVKTRIQTQTKVEGEKPYTGIPNAFASIWKNEGFTAFFKGGVCRVMVVAPLFAIAQVMYFVGIGEYLLGIDKSKK